VYLLLNLTWGVELPSRCSADTVPLLVHSPITAIGVEVWDALWRGFIL